MATRRARIQVKPNIGGKSSSAVKRVQQNVEKEKDPNKTEKETTIQISAELAEGAATAVNFKHGPGSLGQQSSPTKNKIEKVTLSPTNKGDNTSKYCEDVTRTTDTTDISKNVTKEKSPVATNTTFTRLKRFGLNLGSGPRIEKQNEKQSSNRITLDDSPNKCAPAIYSPSKESDILQTTKSQSNDRTMLDKSQNMSAKTSVDTVPAPCGPSKVSDFIQKSPATKPNSSTVTRRFSSNVPKLTVKSPLPSASISMKSPTSFLSVKLSSPQENKSKTQSPEKLKLTMHELPDKSAQKNNTPENNQNKQDPVQANKEMPSKPDVVQRLPFRSRFPKARPNIEALKIRNKNLSLAGKEENSSRPSSPLKSPRVKLFSPLKPTQHIQKTVSPMETEGMGMAQNEVSPELHVKDVAAERRKRHFSNSSISSVNSDQQLKNAKQKSPKTDFSSYDHLDRNSMTMGDLVYWNPVKNPMSATPKKKAKLEKEKEKENVNVQESPPEESTETTDKQSGNMDGADLPVPQVKIGPDGSIIVNEESLIIKKPDEAQTAEVIEENESTATYGSFRKPFNRVSWSEWETEKFYRALSYLGTDFSLMIKLFPKRSRYDIKTKFKREDKLNRNKVEQALKNKKPFDMSFFKKEEELDKQEAARKQKEREERDKKTKLNRLQKKKEKFEMMSKVNRDLTERKSDRKTRGKMPTYYDEHIISDDEMSEIESRPETEDDITEIELTPDTSLKTPVRLPFKRYENAPFVPPFCSHEDSDRENMELQVSMSDSEILSPQKPSRLKVTQKNSVETMLEEGENVANQNVASDENVSIDNGTMSESSVDITSAGFPPNANVQIAHDANNLPLVLVYHTPENGNGETVIHVYQLQNHQLGNVQIPLNTGSVIDLPSSLQTSDRSNLTDSDTDLVPGESEQPITTQDIYEQENLPFIIASGDATTSQLLGQPIGEGVSPPVSSENEGFINIIDINASKINTPQKNINVQIQSNSVSDKSNYHVVTVNPNDVLESTTSSSDVAIENEFIVSDIDKKFNNHLTDKDRTKRKMDR